MLISQPTRWPPAAPAATRGGGDAALILVGHGSRRLGALDGLAAHAAALRRCRRFREVHVAALHGGGPPPTAVLARITAPRAFVVPVMMCAGRTARRDLPAAFAAAVADVGPGDAPGLIHCPPIGTHPALAALIVERAAAAGTAATLLLIGHGSTRDPASHDAALLLAHRVRARRWQGLRRPADVAVAFLEQAPRPGAVLRTSRRPVIAFGLFAGPGQHATSDVAAALAGAEGVRDLGPIGSDPGIARVILAAVDDAAGPADATAGRYMPSPRYRCSSSRQRSV